MYANYNGVINNYNSYSDADLLMLKMIELSTTDLYVHNSMTLEFNAIIANVRSNMELIPASATGYNYWFEVLYPVKQKNIQ